MEMPLYTFVICVLCLLASTLIIIAGILTMTPWLVVGGAVLMSYPIAIALNSIVKYFSKRI